jgi:Ca2+-transporting ATPase
MTGDTVPPDRRPPYQRSVHDVLAAFQTDGHSGLSLTEARARLERYGPNELAAEKPVPAWRKFLAQFQDMLVILLLVAVAISAVLWLHERESALPYEAIAILAVVVLNAVMGHVQESRASPGGASPEGGPKRRSSATARGDRRHRRS